MADATTATCTEKNESRSGVLVNGMNGPYTRTFTFPVLNSATGYGASDVITLVTVPANTQILSIAIAASAAQSGGATFTFAVTGQSAFSAALAPTTANVFFPSAITEANAAVLASDTALTCTIGTATCDAATITVSMVLAPLGANAPSYTTYTT